ncbi:MAG: ABC transporter ATP-binding protein [bacterium]
MNLLNAMSPGRANSLEEEQKNLKGMPLLKIFKVFGRHYKKYWLILAGSCMCLLATIGVGVLTPWPLKLVLDHVILQQPVPDSLGFLRPWLANQPALLLLLLSLSIVLLALLEAFFSYLNKFWVSSTGVRINADIRERVFAHLQRASLSFHDSARSGNLVYLLTSDVENMKDILIDFPQDFLHRLGLFFAYAACMLALDWRLGLIAVSIVPLFYLFTRRFGLGLTNAMTSKRKQEGEVASILAENVSLMALVQAYGRQESERARFNVENQESLGAQLRALRLQKTYSRLTDLLITLSTAGILYSGGLYALQSEILPGTLVVFVAYLRDIYGAAEKFSAVFINLAKARVSGERLVGLVENEMVMQDHPAARPAPHVQGRIEFKNVSFAYGKGKNVFKNLSFVIEPGETVALVGPSGAGKSTLISLLLRFYDPKQGQILIDGQDIRAFTLKSLRDQITILLQDAKLFRQTIRENIALGKIGASTEEIITVAKQAQAHDFIEQLPEGYDTMMTECGDNLSGGQRQLLNIARALMRDTPILILDEPSHGLDVQAEAQINAAVHRLTQQKTTIVIAHKLSTIANADKILRLEEGALSCQSTHVRGQGKHALHGELFRQQSHSVAVAAEAAEKNGHTKLEKVCQAPLPTPTAPPVPTA